MRLGRVKEYYISNAALKKKENFFFTRFTIKQAGGSHTLLYNLTFERAGVDEGED